MKISPYFHDLRSAYQAELDDLVSDSEGKDVLRKRLAEKRNEIAFLVQMMELAPEMVAVVFHQGFRFAKPAAVEQLISLPVDELPAWDTLAGAVQLEPWAQSLAQTVLREPAGGRFLAIAAGLEYLHAQARMASMATSTARSDGDSDADEEAGDDAEHDDEYNALSADDAMEPQNSRTREEAASNWLSDVGFERKE
ncbi:hypothetical protein [Acidovorax sp. RAC01]|uniref:hypothetical protein n=1 Tax=Acidovorax sp. RAC01 TaxID=1842533 RepID=UPI00083E7D57|nr:hypothetical protein [Acidovorax sp. RAC01]AOG21677.1 hypothetical protein BSY15_3341 [Acidovorax sp. RAC01]MDP3495786.1 hypothetical protein [Hyphomonadaceae bacterium]